MPSVRATTNHRGWNDVAGHEPEPWEIASAREQTSDRNPSVLVWGSAPWPYAVQWVDTCGAPQVGATCGACHGTIRRDHYCLVCDSPKGSLVWRTVAAVARKGAPLSGRLKGGKGRKAG